MSDETTTDRLAEIEGQADYTPPEGWRVLQAGEVLEDEDWIIDPRDGNGCPTRNVGSKVGQTQVGEHQIYIRRIEPEPENRGFEGHILREVSQPVQVREGRWRTRGGDIRHVTPTPDGDSRAITYPWHDARCDQTWLSSGRYHTGHTESPLDLFDYLGPIEPEPEQIITPDDVAAEALAGVNEWPNVQTLQRKLETTEAALLEQQQRNEQLVTQGSQQRMQIAELQAQVRFLKNRELTLGTRLEEEKAVTAKRLQQVEELRSEVSYVQGLLGESQALVVQQQNRIQDLLTTNEATEPEPVHQQAMIDAQAETIARLNSEIHGLSIQNAELLAQREAVKDELVQERLERNQWQNHAQRTETQLVEKVSECRSLRIELDALQQAPQAETVAAVPTSTDDRFEEGWDAGTARAVETIAEWLEPIRDLIDAADNLEETNRANCLAADIMQNLPHIMRTLTGLTDED